MDEQRAAQPIDAALLGAIDAAAAALSRTPALRGHFAGEREWLATRRARWTGRTWRVGLIGITSAGKSTLLNALLGAAVLPVHVRPSSNCLVVCRRGRAGAVVRYEDGRTEELRGRRAVRARLYGLADEATNPGNRAGVEEIELTWPDFRCGPDVALIDTPGLDAYGLERHEDITLRLLLPSVDLVVFVTTAKANADGTIRRYLDTIAAHGKPLVLVQNAIDSVEAKPAPGGAVAKSRAEVAREHLRRVRRLAERAGGEAAQAAIVQTSALLAGRGDLDGSNVSALLACIAERLDGLAPRLWRGRLGQLRDKLAEVVSAERARLAGGDDEAAGLAATAEQLATTERELHDLPRRALARLHAAAARLSGEHARLRAEAASLSQGDEEEAQQLVGAADAARTAAVAALGAALDATGATVRAVAQRLLLGEEDYALHPLPVRVRRSLRVPTRERSQSKRRKRSGFFGWLGRVFGADWGWDVDVRTWTVLDVASFRRDLDAFLAADAQWAADLMERIAGDAIRKAERLGAELERSRAAFQAKRDSAAAAAVRRAAVDALAAVAARLPEASAVAAEDDDERLRPVDRPGQMPPPVTVEVPRLTLDLVRLASRLAQGRFAALRVALLERAGRARPGAAREAVIWASDGDSLDRFVARFWPAAADDAEARPLVRSVGPVGGVEQLTVVAAPDVPDDRQRERLVSVVAGLAERPATLFLLVDAEQPGSLASRFAASPLARTGSRQIPVVLVVQSLRGLRNSRELAPALRELRRFGERFRLAVVGVLANDEDATLSCLLDALYRRGDELRGIRDEERWISDLGGNDVEARLAIGDVLAAWRSDADVRSGRAGARGR
jgi:GTPase SAR1 family protein